MTTPIMLIGLEGANSAQLRALIDRSKEAGGTPCMNEPELWWSFDPSEIRFAKDLCGTCPVRMLCGKWALEAPEREGVWGGMDADERATIRRRLRAKGKKE